MTVSTKDEKHQSRPKDTNNALRSLLAGGIAGCCAKTCVAPIDRVKILFQAHNQHYKNLGLVKVLKNVFKKEGLPGLYKGNGAHMIRVFPYAAIQFWSYEYYRKKAKFLIKSPHVQSLSAGSLAGLTAVIITYPLDIIRARIAFQAHGEQIYLGFIHTFQSIKNLEGYTALYRGIIPSLLGMAPYAGIAFYTFETLKSKMMEYFPHIFGQPCPKNNDDLVLNVPGKVICSSTAGVMAQAFAYPLDVVRRRKQLSKMLPEPHKYDQSWYRILWMIYKEDGIKRGLYRGMSLNFLRGIPTVIVSFTINDMLRQQLGLSTSSKR